jgi:hypothetical protein
MRFRFRARSCSGSSIFILNACCKLRRVRRPLEYLAKLGILPGFIAKASADSIRLKRRHRRRARRLSLPSRNGLRPGQSMSQINKKNPGSGTGTQASKPSVRPIAYRKVSAPASIRRERRKRQEKYCFLPRASHWRPESQLKRPPGTSDRAGTFRLRHGTACHRNVDWEGTRTSSERKFLHGCIYDSLHFPA